MISNTGCDGVNAVPLVNLKRCCDVRRNCNNKDLLTCEYFQEVTAGNRSIYLCWAAVRRENLTCHSSGAKLPAR